MIFNTLTIKNFMSIADGKIDLSQGGLIGVFGKNKDSGAFSSNGSGKSSIWDALSWVLFGKPLRTVPAGDVQRKGSNKVEVSLTFEFDGPDSKSYEIIRGRDSSGPFLFLRQDGQDVSRETQSDTQQKILALVEMDWQTFTVAIIFGQDTFRFASATDKEQKQIFDKLLNIQIYDKALEATKTHLNKITAEYDALIVEREKNEFLVKNLESNLALQQQIAEKKETYRKQTLETYKVKLSQLEHTAISTDSAPDINDLQIEMDSLRDQLESLRDRTVAIEKMKGELRIAESEYKSAEIERRRLNDKQSLLSQKLHNMAKMEKCAVCKQAIGEDEAARQRAEVRTERDGLSKNIEEYDAILSDPTVKSAIEDMKKEIGQDTAVGQKQAIMARISVLQLTIDGKRSEHQRIALQIASLQANIAGLSKPNPFDDSQTILRVRESKTLINTLNEQIDQKRLKIDQLKFWEKGFGPGGIRSLLLDSVTPILNQAANHYAAILLDGSVKIEFSTQQQLKTGELKDRFEVKAVNIYGANVYEGNSAGERQRIDICIALALHSLAMSRHSNSINFLVFDEAFERLDVAGCERVMKLLKEMAKEKGTIFVVTHLENLASFFDNSIQILKSGGQSTIYERSVEEKNLRMELPA